MLIGVFENPSRRPRTTTTAGFVLKKRFESFSFHRACDDTSTSTDCFIQSFFV